MSTSMPSDEYRIEPFLLAVLSRRFEAICREMTNTILKASRSSVIKNARDFSVGILTGDHRLVSVEDGLPVHVTALDLSTKAVVQHFSDIRPGDAFVNNCPYTGGTHHADLDIIVPVFSGDEIAFWVFTRCHHADMGAPLPTTYLPKAATIYEEGLHFPCVRIQENYADKADIVRIGLTKIRASQFWFGDYLAQVGASRVGERRLKELLVKYGKAVIEDFVEDWILYGKRRAAAAISQLPSGTWTYETAHDPVPGVAEAGIPVKVQVTVDSAAGRVVVDATNNIDCINGGFNLSEATATAACRIGVYVNLDPTIPHNHGSAEQISVLLRDGCVVGRPKFPAGTSVATTNVNDRLINAVACCFAQMGQPFGIAEGGAMMASGLAVISGTDPRRNNRPYVTQLFLGFSGGPAVHGHDGWVTYNDADTCGMLMLDSIEVDESMYPILVEERKIAIDTMGHGQWDGAPAMTGTYRNLAGTMSVIYCSDGDLNAARGVLGGMRGSPSANYKQGSASWQPLPSFHTELCEEGESMRFVAGGGGGYGDPQMRDPDRVVRSINRGWLSLERAQQIYGVAVKPNADGAFLEVDLERTAALRSKTSTSSTATASMEASK
ncbi:Acetophenone carboxylase delta subunit [Ensifer psoraleae]|nr:Acetophenone carboxylase delta subunit [Sinorhizobium psoraleae]